MSDTVVLTKQVEEVLRKHNLLNKNGKRRKIIKNTDGTFNIHANWWMLLGASFLTAFLMFYVFVGPEPVSFGSFWLRMIISLFTSFVVLRVLFWLVSFFKLSVLAGLFSFVGFRGWLMVLAVLAIAYLSFLVWKPDIGISAYWDSAEKWFLCNTLVGGIYESLNGQKYPFCGRKESTPTASGSHQGIPPVGRTPDSSTPLDSLVTDASRLDARENGFNLHSNGLHTAISKEQKCHQVPGQELCSGHVATDVFPLSCDTTAPCFSGTVSGRRQDNKCRVTTCPTDGSSTDEAFPVLYPADL
jgi:hypothetical protein